MFCPGNNIQPGPVIAIAGMGGYDRPIRGRQSAGHDARAAKFLFVSLDSLLRLGGNKKNAKDNECKSDDRKNLESFLKAMNFHDALLSL
jgi:hypothetical protein